MDKPNDTAAPCCYVDQETMNGCEADAEYEIRDVADPNPYTCLTQSCGAHVGDLLGHSPSVPADADWRWEVVAL